MGRNLFEHSYHVDGCSRGTVVEVLNELTERAGLLRCATVTEIGKEKNVLFAS